MRKSTTDRYPGDRPIRTSLILYLVQPPFTHPQTDREEPRITPMGATTIQRTTMGSIHAVLVGSVLVFLLLAVGTTALSSSSSSAAPPKKYYGGAGVGRFVVENTDKQQKCHYDMVLTERIQGKPRTESGLFVPQADLPRLHLCRVLAVGPGREEDNGRVVPISELLTVGSIVIAKNPWGIGPRDEETANGKKLSYMRAQDIAAVVSGGLVEDE